MNRLAYQEEIPFVPPRSDADALSRLKRATDGRIHYNVPMIHSHWRPILVKEGTGVFIGQLEKWGYRRAEKKEACENG